MREKSWRVATGIKKCVDELFSRPVGGKMRLCQRPHNRGRLVDNDNGDLNESIVSESRVFHGSNCFFISCNCHHGRHKGQGRQW